MAVPLNDFAFIDRLWREWSPGYSLPSAERTALNEMFAQSGALSQTLAYCRQLFAPPPEDPAAQALEARASRAIEAPSLYLHGAEDGCMSADSSEGMEAVFKNGMQQIVLPNVGHFLHLEPREEVKSRILEFLKT